MGFLKTTKKRMTVGSWAADQLGRRTSEQSELFGWAVFHGSDNPENARRLGRLVGIAGFTRGGGRGPFNWTIVFGEFEKNKPEDIVAAFRQGKAEGAAEAMAKIAEE
jgi:hypothetical protein